MAMSCPKFVEIIKTPVLAVLGIKLQEMHDLLISKGNACRALYHSQPKTGTKNRCAVAARCYFSRRKLAKSKEAVDECLPINNLTQEIYQPKGLFTKV